MDNDTKVMTLIGIGFLAFLGTAGGCTMHGNAVNRDKCKAVMEKVSTPEDLRTVVTSATSPCRLVTQ